MPKAVLLVDAIAWVDEDGQRHELDGFNLDPPKPSAKGEQVDLPQAAFDHHLKVGNVAKPRSKDAKAAEAEADEEAEPGE